jgi:hypothetical protein
MKALWRAGRAVALTLACAAVLVAWGAAWIKAVTWAGCRVGIECGENSLLIPVGAILAVVTAVAGLHGATQEDE